MINTMSGGSISAEEEIASLRKQIAELRKAKQPKISLKVSAKGALSVYGLQRMPVTLYRGQWENLLGRSEEIRNFIAANQHLLVTKS